MPGSTADGLAGDTFDDLLSACGSLATDNTLDGVLERHEAVLQRLKQQADPVP